MKKIISVVAPMYNEEANVDVFCGTMFEAFSTIIDTYNLEIILVNDGSKDRTYDKMLAMQSTNPKEITVINLTRNFGLEGALYAGLRLAKGDAVVVMDADLQDPPSVIPKMLAQWETGADVVVAKRAARKSDSFMKRFTASCFYKLLDSLSEKLKLEHNAANFRLLSRRALDALLTLKEVNAVFRILVPFVGMRTAVVEYERDARYAGKTKYNFKSLFLYSLDGLTGISIAPLRKVFLTIPISIIIAVLCILGFLFSSEVYKGYFLLSIIISVFFIMTFVCISVLSEYMAQIFKETKKRPISMIYEHRPCKNAIEKEREDA